MSAVPTAPVGHLDPGPVPLAPPPSKGARVLSRDPATFPMPTGREEDWRFTPLRRIQRLLEPGSLGNDPAEISWHAPTGVVIGRVAAGDSRVGRALVPADRLAALAMDRTVSPLLVQVPAGLTAAEPVTVTVTGRGGLSFEHLIVELGAQASATVVLDHRGSGAFGGNVELVLAEGSALTLVSVQDWDRSALHGGAHAALVGRDARLRTVTVTLGGDLVRLTPTVAFAGPGGDADLAGVYLTGAGQHHEHRLFVDHEAPHCRSRVTYKGALQGQDAHSVWIGDVLIGAGAEDTDTYELNRNLVLTEGARADSVPNLEIETGAVTGAGHASATGRFDDEQLFYLMARGIPADEARRLVVRGFFAEVIDRIPVPELRDRLLAAVDAELAGPAA